MRLVLSVFIIILLCSFTAEAKKQQRVGCVDIQKVFEKAPGKSEAYTNLQKLKDTFIKEKEKMEAEIERLKKDLENTKLMIGETEVKKKELEIETKKQDLAKFIKDSNTNLEKKEDELIAPIVNKIRGIIETVCIKKGFNFVIDKSTYILYVDEEFDLTEFVIEEMKKIAEEEKEEKE